MTNQNCPDFSTATDLPPMGVSTASAWRIADAMGLPELDKEKFTQGFIHARQGRSELFLTGSAVYDAGHTVGALDITA